MSYKETILRPLKTANPQVLTWEFAQQCHRAADLIEELCGWLNGSAETMVAIAHSDKELLSVIQDIASD